MRLPVPTTLLAGVAVLSLATACGSSSGSGAARPATTPGGSSATTSPATTSPTTAPATAPPSSTTLSLAQAKAVAKAGLVTAAELPGFKGEAQTQDASDRATNDAVARCVGTTTSTGFLYSDPGTAFSNAATTLEIDSSVDITKTAAAASQDLTAIASAQGQACLKTNLTKIFQDQGGVKVTNFVLKPVSGVTDGYGYALELTLTAKGQSITLAGYQLGSVTGQAEISVDDIGTGGAPLPLAKAQALLAAATARAEKAQA